jgi:hypothetical protein
MWRDGTTYGSYCFLTFGSPIVLVSMADSFSSILTYLKSLGYDQPPTQQPTLPSSEETKKFIQVFEFILNHKVGQDYIRLEDGMQARILDSAHKAFEAWSSTGRWHCGSSSSFSVSTGSILQCNSSQSLLGGSYHRVSASETSVEHKTPTTQPLEVVRNHGYSTEMKEMPLNSSTAAHTRTILPSHAEQNGLSRYLAVPGGQQTSFTNNIVDGLLGNTSTPTAFAGQFTNINFLPGNFNGEWFESTFEPQEENFGSTNSPTNDNREGFPSLPGSINQEIPNWSPFPPTDYRHS